MRTTVRPHIRRTKTGRTLVSEHTRRYQPMRPKAKDVLPTGPNWIYSPKLDGTRIMFYDTDKTELITRRDNDLTEQFPEFKDLNKKFKGKGVIDGELIVDGTGYGNFKKLSERTHLKDKKLIEARAKKNPATFVAFDVLQEDGKYVTNRPLKERMKILDKIIPKDDPRIKVIEMTTDLEKLDKQIKAANAEGIVAKDINSKYKEGAQTDEWIKKKNLKENDVVVLGFTQGTGKRKDTFGAMLLGVWDKNKWEYVGKVGTGLEDPTLKEYKQKMEPLKINKPLINIPGTKDVQWIEPKIVARIKFKEETHHGHYKEPVWISERMDISAKETHPFVKVNK